MDWFATGKFSSQNQKLMIMSPMGRLIMAFTLKKCTLVRMANSRGLMLVFELVLGLVLGCVLALGLVSDFSCVHIKPQLIILGGGFSDPDHFKWKFVILVLIKGRKPFEILNEIFKDFKIVGEEARDIN